MKSGWNNIFDSENLVIDYNKEYDEFRFSWFEDCHFKDERFLSSAGLVSVLFGDELDDWAFK